MTYFTINDPATAVSIKDGTGLFGATCCVGASFDESQDNVEKIRAKLEKKEEKKRLKKQQNDEKKKSTKRFEPPARLKKTLFWLCGIEQSLNKPEISDAELERQQEIDTSIEEDPFWSTVCNINAIIAMSVAAFCFAFFNKFEN